VVEVVFVAGTQTEALDVDLLFDHVLRLFGWIIKLDYGDFYANFNSLNCSDENDRQIGHKTKFKYHLIRIICFSLLGLDLLGPFLFFLFTSLFLPLIFALILLLRPLLCLLLLLLFPYCLFFPLLIRLLLLLWNKHCLLFLVCVPRHWRDCTWRSWLCFLARFIHKVLIQ
jgi:hypothetical protein